MVERVSCPVSTTKSKASKGELQEGYKSYSAYKPSGNEWLGDIPRHWEVLRLKHLSTRYGLYGANVPGSSYVADGVRFIRTTDITEYGQLKGEGILVPAELVQDYVLEDGDILLSRSGTVGRSFLYKQDHHGPCAYAGYLVRYALNERAYPEYVALYAQTAAFGAFVRSTAISSTIDNVNAEKYSNSVVPRPPLAEQRAIAAFLDRETAKIDALVARKERLIELLQEKRTALISRAVTRGLDPDVRMKDSDVEWLGEIPAHWHVKRLKHLAGKIGSGKTPKGGAEVYVDEGIMLIRSQNVHFGGLRLSDVVYIDAATDAEMAGSRVREGDVLLNITGASLGRCCTAYLDGSNANVNQHVCIVRPDQQQDDPSFLAYSVESDSVQDQIFNNENGVSRDALNFEQIGDMVLARPPMVEQQAIVCHLDRESAKLEVLIARVQDAIKHLKELRVALVSAAVTGRIDVRKETT